MEIIQAPSFSATQKLPDHGDCGAAVMTSTVIKPRLMTVLNDEFARAKSIARIKDHNHHTAGWNWGDIENYFLGFERREGGVDISAPHSFAG